MPDTFPRAPHPAKTGPQGQWGAAVAETRGRPESSLLFSAATTLSSQDVLGRRASELGTAAQAGRTSVPPSDSIHTIREWGHRRSASYLSIEPMAYIVAYDKRPSATANTTVIASTPQQPHIVRHLVQRPACLAPQPAPPPLRRLAPIALPPLSPLTPVQIHPVITYHPSPTGPDAPVHWNMSLPPSTARLAFALGGISTSRWSREVAVEPRTLPSMTVRIAGVARPVVVFPAEMGYPVRIVDVLWAVYSALRLAAIESVGGPAAGAVGWRCSGEDVVVDDAVAADAIRAYFRGDVWWGGLYESPEERDVWVLELRGTKTRWY